MGGMRAADTNHKPVKDGADVHGKEISLLPVDLLDMISGECSCNVAPGVRTAQPAACVVQLCGAGWQWHSVCSALRALNSPLTNTTVCAV